LRRGQIFDFIATDVGGAVDWFHGGVSEERDFIDGVKMLRGEA